jgi:hypothetical protein
MSQEARHALAERLRAQGIRFARSPVTTVPNAYHIPPVVAGRIYGVGSLVHALHLIGLNERALEEWMQRSIEPVTPDERLGQLDPRLQQILEAYPWPGDVSDEWYDAIAHQYATMPRWAFIRWAEWGWCPRTYCVETAEGHALCDGLAEESPFNPARRGPTPPPCRAQLWTLASGMLWDCFL